jgi:hypothetical protein
MTSSSIPPSEATPQPRRIGRDREAQRGRWRNARVSQFCVIGFGKDVFRFDDNERRCESDGLRPKKLLTGQVSRMPLQEAEH